MLFQTSALHAVPDTALYSQHYLLHPPLDQVCLWFSSSRSNFGSCCVRTKQHSHLDTEAVSIQPQTKNRPY